jgi:hypothetical protein
VGVERAFAPEGLDDSARGFNRVSTPGNRWGEWFLGLKPQAESLCPFGARNRVLEGTVEIAFPFPCQPRHSALARQAAMNPRNNG